jgi:transposase
MKRPIFVRSLTDTEREELEAGLRSSDAFVMRRCQILLASAKGEQVPRIALNLSCNDQTVRNAIKAFNERGTQCLNRGSSRPRTVHTSFDDEGVLGLRELLHHSPRVFGKPTSLWTLEMAAEVSFEQGLTSRLTSQRVSGETIRATLARLGMRWQRAKQWINSPDPGYARKKRTGTG